MLCPAQNRARTQLTSLLGIKPYEHQSQAAAMMLARFETVGSFGLLHSIGCGKTLTMLGAFLILHACDEAESMLIVCPSSVIGSWEKECIGVVARTGKNIDVLALTGPVAKREANLQHALLLRSRSTSNTPLVVITNYEGVWRMEAVMKAAGFSVIACDESQRIKAPGSKQSRAMHRIGKTCRYRAIMSGTPLPEGPLGIYGQMRFLDDRVFGTSHVNFRARYAVEINMGTFRKVVGTQNLEELESKVMSRSHLVSKDDALDLPPEIDTVIEFDLSPKARKIYDKVAKDCLAEIEDEFGTLGEVVAESVLTKMLRLQQITSGFVKLDDQDDLLEVDDTKLRALRETLEDILDAGGKAVVFHRFTRDGEQVRALADKLAGCAQPFINGSVPGDQRGDMVRRFQEDDDARVFVAQIQAAGLGVTLTAAATSVFYSVGYSGADYEQARGRIHRISQTSKVVHVHLVARKTVDEHVIDALRNKRRIADDVTSGAWRRWLGG